MAKWKYRKKYFIEPNNSQEEIDSKGFRGYLFTKLAKRELVFMLIAVLFATTTVIGGSYAVFSNIQKAEQYNVIKSGTLQIAYDDTSEGLGNIIRLNGAYPESDAVGQEREPYRFKITNTGSLNAEYKVKILDDISMIEEDGCQDKLLDKTKIKYSIDKGTPIILSTTAEEYVVVTGSLSAGESVTYEVRMWIDEGAGNEVLGTHYHGKIVVEGVQMESLGKASDVLFDKARLGEKGTVDTSDEEQTFITGEEPNNYIWYSGKLWRAVSKDTSDNSVKLVTQWNISAIPYNPLDHVDFKESYMETWLNDTSVDGFLGNLREPEKFIKMDSSWNATMMTETTKPSKTTMVTDTVGLLNIYEYTMSYKGTTIENGYLNSELYWWSLTPAASNALWFINYTGELLNRNAASSYGIRPSINLKSDVKVVSGIGTEKDPYRLQGDTDQDLKDTLLANRYSGEYVYFGIGENNLYRIVSKESGMIKLISVNPLKKNGAFLSKKFNVSTEMVSYSPTDTAYELAYFLNHDYLNATNGYLTSEQINMIESSPWYLGMVSGGNNYKLAKYSSCNGTVGPSCGFTTKKVNAKVGLLRLGEQFSARTQKMTPETEKTFYWLLTSHTADSGTLMIRRIDSRGGSSSDNTNRENHVRPAVHLKSTVKITGGDGTKQNPFTISE